MIVHTSAKVGYRRNLSSQQAPFRNERGLLHSLDRPPDGPRFGDSVGCAGRLCGTGGPDRVGRNLGSLFVSLCLPPRTGVLPETSMDLRGELAV